MKRIKVVPCRPNRLFENWLEEWKDAAKERSDKHYMGLSKALKSLKKYPLKLDTGKDCIIIQHFGIKLCQMIDTKLAKHLEAQAKLSGDNTIITADFDTNVKRKKPKARLPSPSRAKQVSVEQVVLPPPPPPVQPPVRDEETTNVALRFKPSSFDVVLLVDCHEVERFILLININLIYN